MNSSIWRLVHQAIHKQRHKYNKQKQGIGLNHLQLNLNAFELKIKINYINKISGKHLKTMNIYPSDTRDMYLRGTFHAYSLQTLLWGLAKSGQYWTKALHRPGPYCCSTRSVTFSAVDSGKMHTLNYILYHLNVFSRPGLHGTKLAPTLIPETEVTKHLKIY